MVGPVLAELTVHVLDVLQETVGHTGDLLLRECVLLGEFVKEEVEVGEESEIEVDVLDGQSLHVCQVGADGCNTPYAALVQHSTVLVERQFGLTDVSHVGFLAVVGEVSVHEVAGQVEAESDADQVEHVEASLHLHILTQVAFPHLRQLFCEAELFLEVRLLVQTLQVLPLDLVLSGAEGSADTFCLG